MNLKTQIQYKLGLKLLITIILLSSLANLKLKSNTN